MQRFPDLIERYRDWTCAQCGQPLALSAVLMVYMGSEFTVELPACPPCGVVVVPEGLALGKMLEVEQILEDK